MMSCPLCAPRDHMLLPGRETSPRLPTKVFDFTGPENQVRYKSEDGTELEAKITAIRFGDREGDWSDIPCPVEGGHIRRLKSQ